MPKFVGVEEVSALLCVSRSRAYKIMRQLNKELEAQGKITTCGRISSKYLLERTTV
ncbi:MAG: transcriptional regulator [Lachnospiraceae bacterium]|nr:transcriptional regulator [Lachnospiraceae bacterium]